MLGQKSSQRPTKFWQMFDGRVFKTVQSCQRDRPVEHQIVSEGKVEGLKNSSSAKNPQISIERVAQVPKDIFAWQIADDISKFLWTLSRETL